MRSSFIPALSLLLSSCAVVTTSGTEEAVYFSDKESGNGQAHAVLKPHNDLPMTIEFSCPDKLATAMTSVWVPFPPVLPVGFVNEKLSYLRITVPQDAGYANAQIRVTTQQGQPVPMLAEPQSRRVGKDSGEAQLTYVLKQDCETLDGGLLEVAGFSYKNRNYPAIGSRLHFDSRLKLRIGPGIA
ncbi:hypothetical protein GCM10027343_31210 [Noviherbaspirillum agri]